MSEFKFKNPKIESSATNNKEKIYCFLKSDKCLILISLKIALIRLSNLLNYSIFV